MFVLQEFCTSSGFQEQARDFFENTLGLSIKSETARWLGVPGALRGAEAMDSIVNFVDSAQADEGESVIGYIVCGIIEVFAFEIRTAALYTSLTVHRTFVCVAWRRRLRADRSDRANAYDSTRPSRQLLCGGSVRHDRVNGFCVEGDLRKR
jgi:hypothetical protein